MTNLKKAIIKTCPKCNTPFQCMENQIEKCHCNSIKLSEGQLINLKSIYNDCLCSKCLKDFASKK